MRAINVLLVDDQLSSLIALEEILATLDANLIKASSAKQALRFLIEEDIDCILLDVSMPEMDGFEFLQTMKKAPAHAGIPVIMVTGKIFSENETLRAYQSGAVDFLLKPLDADVVYRKVSFFVNQSRQVKCLASIEKTLKKLPGEIVELLKQVQTEAGLASDVRLQNAIASLSELYKTWRSFRNEKDLLDL